ncbi:MAG: two-component sensor histidine kinase [Lachnospiraceae bacterium]|nr:two-component sensor histidine kinase [Lachnospiraceae bacterium]
MRAKIHKELLATSALATLLTLLLSMFAFYGIFKEQVIADLRADAMLLKSMHVFEKPETLHPDGYELEPDKLRITVIAAEGAVLFDTNAAAASMESHEGRPEVREALLQGEGYGSRRSETLDKKLFYYALDLGNGSVLRISREARSFFSVAGNLLPMAAAVALFLFPLCLIFANYFTKGLMKPIEQMAENLSDTDVAVAYKEFVPFVSTIRRQHEAILKNAALRQEFTANVSHELKTPLTAISGYAQLIEHGMAGEENTARFAGEIQKNSKRLLSLINDILQLSRLDEKEQELEDTDVDLYGLAEDCIRQLEMAARHQEVTIRLSGKTAVIRADRHLIEELAYNLCDNAIRYNNRGGRVTVTVSETAGRACLSVQDSGIGIPKEHQIRVFERFYRVDKSRSRATGGTGLGLAIVKHIAAQYGAEISLESEEGQGTKIRVCFPVK